MARPGRREQIVEAAIAILSTEGPAGFTAAALAARAKVSKANLFHHFENLDAIMVAAFERFLDAMPAMRPAPGTSLRDWLLALGGETMALVDERRTEAGAYVAFLARAQSDARLCARLEQVVAGAERAFAAAIRLTAPGRWTDEEAESLAGLILLAGDGLAVHRQLFPDRSAGQQAAWRALVDRIAPEEPA